MITASLKKQIWILFLFLFFLTLSTTKTQAQVYNCCYQIPSDPNYGQLICTTAGGTCNGCCCQGITDPVAAGCVLDSNNCCQFGNVTSTYNSSALYTWQKQIQDSFESGQVDVNTYIAGTDFVSKDGYGGTVNATVKYFVTAVIGTLVPVDGNNNLVNGGGAIAGTTRLLTYILGHPPASSVDYFADVGRNFGIVKTAYAQQGVGFQALSPILPIWKEFRNVAYVFFVLIFLGIGFMIMFRIKINPQTAITIQNAIPKALIALVLVTFSYAIAGFMIDLMYLVTAVGIALINPGQTMLLGKVLAILQAFPVIPGFAGLGQFISGLGNIENPSFFLFSFTYISQGAHYALALTRMFHPVAFMADMFNAPQVVVEALETVPFFQIPLLGQLGDLIALALGAVLLFTLFKTLFALLKSYIQIMFGIIFAPLLLMLNAVPGQNTFGSWLRNLIGNIAVFPAVILFLALSSKILEAANGGNLWLPPILSFDNNWPNSGRFVVAIIGYGMLLLMPKVIDMVHDTLKVPPFKYGSAIGEGLSPITRTGKRIWGAGKGVVVDTGKGIIGAALPSNILSQGGNQQPLSGSNLRQGGTIGTPTRPDK